MLKVYVIGLFILLIAILANVLGIQIGLLTWYDFIKLIAEFKSSAFEQVGLKDSIWLLAIYPFILGLGYKIGHKFYNTFILK
ncbi:MAG: DUF7672 family protein [bacterium]